MTKRIAIVHKERCNPQGCGGYLCMKVCPSNRMGLKCKEIDIDGKIKINEELCTSGCSICAQKCPFDAIKMINLPEKLTDQPIHRYGQNKFVLYNLPTPRFGMILGLVGRNGMGKSTAVKILARTIQPNLGKYEDTAGVSFSKILDYFKGSEAQTFFQQLHDGKIRTVYKPQHVDSLRTTTGTVREVLKKVDQRNSFEETVKLLDLHSIIDSDITTLSGGELQRVAIAMTALKKAELYIFDEPTSYLDIKQRLNMAYYLTTLVNEKNAVMVVEHDLVILDYLTDLINILYGEEGGYGIVSHPKNSKEGINQYLEGYMPDENMRFRDHSITFDIKPPATQHKTPELATWDNITKELGQFKLHAHGGTLHKQEVIGVLGENGTGKTTFINILAGIMPQDSGVIQSTNMTSSTMKIAHKPQYIEATDEIVMTLLGPNFQKYQSQIRRLNIQQLMLRKLSELSGGELQRVMIAATLCKEADLYLFDEPSAYLDSEQRIEAAKTIKEAMNQREKTAVVVDHDLLFVDYLSDKIIVLQGTPGRTGTVHGPYEMEEGMNKFLSSVGITLRRDPHSKRPRMNKKDSQLDKDQKAKGKYYYG